MEEITRPSNFIHDIIDYELREGINTRVQTRFPPEPNGYLHIGHAKAICIDFSTAEKYGGICNLRLDDSNPSKEDTEYIDAIKEDIEWLGYKWANVYYASDYFDFVYECAIKLIKKGKAYVCDLSAEEMREYLDTITGVSVGSDAFFPFSDNIERAKRSGVSFIAEPGGSIRDDLVIECCDKYGIVMAFTKMRLFHH